MGVISGIILIFTLIVFVYIPAYQIDIQQSYQAQPFCISNGFLAYKNIGGVGYCYDNLTTKELIYMNDHWTFLER